MKLELTGQMKFVFSCSKAGVKYISKYLAAELKDCAQVGYVMFGPTKTPFWLHPKTGALARFPKSPFAKSNPFVKAKCAIFHMV